MKKILLVLAMIFILTFVIGCPQPIEKIYYVYPEGTENPNAGPSAIVTITDWYQDIWKHPSFIYPQSPPDLQHINDIETTFTVENIGSEPIYYCYVWLKYTHVGGCEFIKLASRWHILVGDIETGTGWEQFKWFEDEASAEFVNVEIYDVKLIFYDE